MSTFMGIVIALFAALIAYFQWRTAHQRVILDLFDRRTSVFREIEAAARDVVNDHEVDASFWRFARAEADGRFLFGEDVTKALEAVRKDLATVMAFKGVAPDHPERQQMIDAEYAARQRVAAFVLDPVKLFAPYIRLDQRMPTLWWDGPGRG